MPVLVLKPGEPDEREFTLAEGTHVIGRAENNSIFVPSKNLSRRHAEIEVRGDQVVVRDLESKNGTFVNGQRVQSCEISEGDRVSCGSAVFELRRAPSVVPTAISRTGRQTLDTLLGRGKSASALRIAAGDHPAVARLRVLLEVSQMLSAPVTLDTLLGRVLDLAFQILDVDRGALLLAEPGSAALFPRVSRGASGDEPFYSTSVVGWVQATGNAGLFADMRSDPRVAGAASIVAHSICSSMCAPLQGKERLLGVLYVDNVTTPGRFRPEDLEFLAAFASQAAVAIEAAHLRHQLEREAVLRNSLLRFFPPATAHRVQESGDFGLAAVDTEVTALFADISGFTELSSRLQPRQVVELLNEYFPVMCDIVFSLDGTLEKYIGDALMAVWGAPFAHDDDADRAATAAVRMQRAMRTFSERWGPRLGGPLQIHIGLNTGPVAAGNIGSEGYVQYATIGDATNVAARLCSVAGPGEILIAEKTRTHLRQPPCPLLALPPVSVKGKAEPIDVHRLRWEED